MTVPRAYSIRESLQGALLDFLREGGFTCANLQTMIGEIVGRLAAYQEEGSPLFPDVFVFSNLQALKAVAPTESPVVLGTVPLGPDAAPLILKNCAPLARGGWAVFAACEGATMRYGLFRSFNSPLAMSAEETMLDLSTEAAVVLVRNRGRLIVDLLCSNRSTMTVSLTTIGTPISRLAIDVQTFVQAATSGLSEPAAFQNYLNRVITRLLQNCHGTLLAVVESLVSDKSYVSDGIWLDYPLQLSQLFAEAKSSGTAEALAKLQSTEALLEGMLNSDGLVLFGNDGTVVAYRVFLSSSEGERARIQELGGGRRRAFELMKMRLSAVFLAVLFRSQDGETECEGRNV